MKTVRVSCAFLLSAGLRTDRTRSTRPRRERSACVADDDAALTGFAGRLHDWCCRRHASGGEIAVRMCASVSTREIRIGTTKKNVIRQST